MNRSHENFVDVHFTQRWISLKRDNGSKGDPSSKKLAPGGSAGRCYFYFLKSKYCINLQNGQLNELGQSPKVRETTNSNKNEGDKTPM